MERWRLNNLSAKSKTFKWDAQAERALDLMEHGKDHVFITGQAGTGKIKIKKVCKDVIPCRHI